MNLNERERLILRSIAHKPRTAHQLTHAPSGIADITCSPHVIHIYLSRLEERGLIALGPREVYTATEQGQALAQEQPQLVTSRFFGNASMTAPYVPPVWSIRAGGEDHRRYASRGIGA